MLTLTGIRKTFASAIALDGANLDISAGTIHGVLGENGAGKSTLMRILFGLTQPDAGAMAIGGSTYAPRSPRDARQRGIGMVHQHFTLVPSLSVRDNCVLSAGNGLGVVGSSSWDERIATLGERLHWRLDPKALVGDLAVGQQQRVEIAKALLSTGVEAGDSMAGRILILDEPTAVLTPPEVEDLLPALRNLASAGGTILFISHKLPEVLRVCDAVTVLRRGKTVHSGPAAAVDAEGLASHMVGEDRPVLNMRGPGVPTDAPDRLVISSLSLPGALHDVSLRVRSGEVVGIAGVDGNGQRELVRAILGLQPGARGLIDTPGLPAAERLRGSRRLGVIPDDRQHEALVLELPLIDNLALGDHRDPPWSRFGLRQSGFWRSHAADLVRRFGIRAPSLDLPMSALSGGNQQRAVAARALHRGPGLVVAVNPTRGLDIAASADVMARLAAARNAGAGVLLIHHDLDELCAISDSMLVLYGGRLSDSAWPLCDRQQIGSMMLGMAAHA